MLPRLVLIVIFVFGVNACNQGYEPDSDTKGVPTAIVKPQIRPRDADTLLNISKELITAANLVKFSPLVAKQNIEKTLLTAIVDAEGIPRSQIKDIFMKLLDPSSTACSGASCARVFGIKQSEVDDLLDKLRDQVENSASLNQEANLRSRNILLESLERSNISFDPARKRTYTIGGKTYNEMVYFSEKPSHQELQTISLEREVAWTEGSEVIRETYRGYVSYGLRNDVLEVHTLDSMPEGKGTGSLVMKRLAEKAQSLGKPTIHTLSTAPTAHDFYYKIGFRPEKNEVSHLAKTNPDLYQSTLNAARMTPGFASKSIGEREAIVDKALGKLIATWEANASDVLKNTQSIRPE
jgi:hypothetical protein